MVEIDVIKQAPDVVVVHRYQGGRLVATEYRSSLGMAVERYDSVSDSHVDPIVNENEPEPAASEPKHKRR